MGINRTTKDLAWQVLPKELKEEVKKEYKYETSLSRKSLMDHLFGHHNLTSDAEGEEMLWVSRKKVQELYEVMRSEQERKDLELCNQVSAEDRAAMLQDLFGSKCLMDEEPKSCGELLDKMNNIVDKILNAVEPKPAGDVDFNVPEPDCKHFKDDKCAHPAVSHIENGKLVKGADCDVSSCEDVEYEPNPAEPIIFGIESDKVSVLNYTLLKLEEAAKAVREALTKIN